MNNLIPSQISSFESEKFNQMKCIIKYHETNQESFEGWHYIFRKDMYLSLLVENRDL